MYTGTQGICCKMIQMFTIFSSISNLSICEKFVSFPQALHCTVFVPSKYFTNMLIPGAVWMDVLQWPTSCTRVHTVCELWSCWFSTYSLVVQLNLFTKLPDTASLSIQHMLGTMVSVTKLLLYYYSSGTLIYPVPSLYLPKRICVNKWGLTI
jgi:hypothetical protein